MITGDAGNYSRLNEQQLRELVATNAGALQQLRTALSNQCRVSVEFSVNYEANHLNDIAGFKPLAQLLATEARLAEMEGRPGDAARSYLDAIHLSIECARGGVVIDQLVGTAIETIGVAGLQKLVEQLDAKSCRDAAAALETYDAQGQSWQQVMQQERDWSRRTFPSVRYEMARLMSRKSLNAAEQAAERKFNQHEIRERQLMIALAARAYELDKGHPPASVSSLAPDYLNAIPQDPFTGTNMVYRP